ncbi:MAG: amino acid aminotransferase [Pseudomonadota bacterium]
MFEKLTTLPADPILGLNQTFQQDTRAEKVNLSIGVYQDTNGLTPIFGAVKKAEQRLIDQQNTKAYAPQVGDPSFVDLASKLLVGEELSASRADEIATVMTPGGCGALRMGAELLVSARHGAKVWVSSPTWANHFPLLESAGLELVYYDYYNLERNEIEFDAMLNSLSGAREGDVVLLHGCCHNPTGADLSPEQWEKVIDLCKNKNLMPFIDVAYQGFGGGLEEDAFGVRLAVSTLPEVLIASSCSKNFGLYRERTGCVIAVCDSATQAAAAKSHILSAARRSYSMAPYHGGGIVGLLLSQPDLVDEWKSELAQVRDHMNTLRQRLADGLNESQSVMNFDFVKRSSGMFCYLGVPKELVIKLREVYGIYLLETTRINIAGLSDQNLPIVIDRVASLLSE